MKEVVYIEMEDFSYYDGFVSMETKNERKKMLLFENAAYTPVSLEARRVCGCWKTLSSSSMSCMSNTDRVCSPSRSAMAPRGRTNAVRSESGRCGRLPTEITVVGRSFSVEYSTPVLRAGEID